MREKKEIKIEKKWKKNFKKQNIKNLKRRRKKKEILLYRVSCLLWSLFGYAVFEVCLYCSIEVWQWLLNMMVLSPQGGTLAQVNVRCTVPCSQQSTWSHKQSTACGFLCWTWLCLGRTKLFSKVNFYPHRGLEVDQPMFHSWICPSYLLSLVTERVSGRI